MKRVLLVAGVLLVLGAGAAAAYKVITDEDPPQKRGSATVEFDPGDAPKPKPPPKKVELAWPTFGYDGERTKVSPYPHRPPFHRTWKLDGRNALEFPPSAAFGNVYLAQQKGLFFAVNGKTGKRVFKTKNFKRCAASSPTLANNTIYQSYMDWVPCQQGASNPTGFVIAMNAKTGRRKWIVRGKPFESSPLLHKGVLYVGSWDGNVYAIRARDGKKIWAHQTGDRVNTSASYAGGRIFIANDSGTLYAINARTGRRIWSKSDATEFFYATPVTAYGRVYIGGTDGTMYAYGQKTGNLLWAKPLGTYVYSSAAVYKRRVFTGTYDGKLYALDAATGDTRWKRDVPSAVHGSPVVMGGLVYAADCSSCGSAAARNVKHGAEGVAAYDIRNGHRVWHNGAGKFASPIIADEDRVYLTGRDQLFALVPVNRDRTKSRTKRRAR
jgi:outer membrane protein assembly factor BamB